MHFSDPSCRHLLTARKGRTEKKQECMVRQQRRQKPEKLSDCSRKIVCLLDQRRTDEHTCTGA